MIFRRKPNLDALAQRTRIDAAALFRDGLKLDRQGEAERAEVLLQAAEAKYAEAEALQARAAERRAA